MYPRQHFALSETRTGKHFTFIFATPLPTRRGTMIDYLLVEQALSGVLRRDRLNFDESNFHDRYKPVFEIGRLAHRMAEGYYAHKIAIEVAKDPRANTLVTGVDDKVCRNDGSRHVFNPYHYLDFARTNPEMIGDLKRVWIVGALVAIGDALSPDYLNHAPILELIYHLRNGVAHGNRFTFRVGARTPGLDRLKQYPAHNDQARLKTARFHIRQDLEGKSVLFDCIGAGDVLDLLMSVGTYLTHLRALQPLERNDLLLSGGCS
jgi:hypothetical protein